LLVTFRQRLCRFVIGARSLATEATRPYRGILAMRHVEDRRARLTVDDCCLAQAGALAFYAVIE
jgi:hypothetical protein